MEQTRTIKGYTNIYTISTNGVIYSLPRGRKNGKGKYNMVGRIKNQYKANNGYMHTRLWKDGKSKLLLIHRLVAQTFINNPLKLRCVNHIDGDKNNNNVSNLEWVSYSENMYHAYENGLCPIGSARHNSKLSEEQVREIKSTNWGISHSKIAIRYGVTRESIRDILNGKRWKWLTI